MLIPYYDQIEQTGLEAQSTLGGWLLKLEAIRRAGQGDPFLALAGGFEYTLVGLLGSAMDLGVLAEEKGQELTIEMPQNLPSLWADQAKLHLILSNLVSNAIKFTPEGGDIRVEAKMDEDRLNVAVTDTGIGIPEQEQDRIFDRFYQVEDSLRRQFAGMGLGLSIVKGLVELHQGRLWVESKVGEGSTFYFTISRHLARQPHVDQR